MLIIPLFYLYFPVICETQVENIPLTQDFFLYKLNTNLLL